MGNTCQGQTADDKKKAKRSRQIDTLMKDINQESQDEVKLLLLGTLAAAALPFESSEPRGTARDRKSTRLNSSH